MILEKPFGTDLDSARALNARAARGASTRSRSSGSTTSSARRRCRTSSRCASPTASFEPVWNRDHIDYVQIDVPEAADDRRAAPGSTSRPAAFRDMVVTHLLQVLGFVAMEPPVVARRPSRCATADGEGLRLDASRSTRPTSSAASTTATATSRASRPTRPSRRSSPRASRSTTGAGRACRSSCAPGKAMAQCRARPSPSSSRSRRCGCSSAPTDGRATPATSSRFELHDPARDRARVPRQGARPARSTVEESELDFGVRAADRDKLAGAVRAPVPRRAARRPDAVHPRRRRRAPLGGGGAAARAPAAPRSPTRRAAGARTRPSDSPGAAAGSSPRATRGEHLGLREGKWFRPSLLPAAG